MLEPKHPGQENAVILEFKVRSTRKEKSLEETAQSALAQIKQRKYREELKTKSKRLDELNIKLNLNNKDKEIIDDGNDISDDSQDCKKEYER
jgi:hypothetical protein